MGQVTFARQPGARTARIATRRERLTIDFRSHGPALAAIAHSRRMTAAALARSVLGEWLQSQSVADATVDAAGTEPDESMACQKAVPFAKVTLRMPADRIRKLAREARAAELSQGMYVAQLLDAQADAPADAGPRALLATVIRSNAELAGLHVSLQSLVRTLKQTSAGGMFPGLDLDALAAEIRQHLASTAPQIAALPASWRRAPGKPDKSTRG